MKTIYKYPLEAVGKQTVIMPVDAHVLTVQAQGETACVWAMVNTDNKPESRVFEIIGTGDPICWEQGVKREYIGTFQLQGGVLVFHLFEWV